MQTNLITRQGYQELQDELNYLWKCYRPKIIAKVTWAAGLGDRSENADYHYNKRILHDIDRRVRHLRRVLKQVWVVDYSPQQEGKVFFGAWVAVKNLEGEVKRFRIAGPDEIYKHKDYISINSPVARALIKKTVHDEAEVITPSGRRTWYITAITYHE
ncbi:transcription elongation factor GreB [Sodalis endosymbiont of Henestaris halophilus]|uniref:transcription elongation factor GreB n=1 Tax=Sodalis endosymbiont of Henestaris halophilus TaxID=1929246 RepID=UPI000BE3ED4C|nr:transcription elongation factor GreB [Sodalis endosymbiont of Henestaris halophilus]